MATIDLAHIGTVLKLEAAIVEAAAKHNIISDTGAFVFTDGAAVGGFIQDVLLVLGSYGVVLPSDSGKVGKIIKLLPVLLTLIEA